MCFNYTFAGEITLCSHPKKMLFPQNSPLQSSAHPLKAVPIAVADDEGSESEEDEFKPRGK